MGSGPRVCTFQGISVTFLCWGVAGVGISAAVGHSAGGDVYAVCGGGGVAGKRVTAVVGERGEGREQ